MTTEFPPHFNSVENMLALYYGSDSVPPLTVELMHHPRLRGLLPGPRNEKGYRSDSFEERGDVNLAFIGDSWVEGQGINRGDLFTDQVAQLYTQATGRVTKSWNLGQCGTGIDHVVRMMPSICKTLRPDFLLVMLSGFDRREYFTPNGRRHLWIQPQPRRVAEGTLKMAQEDIPYVHALGRFNNPNENAAYMLRNFRAVQGMLEAVRMPWMFTSTEYPGAFRPMAELLEFGALPAENYLGFIFERQDRIREGDPHPGSNSHLRFAERIVDKLVMMELPKATKSPIAKRRLDLR